MTSRGIIDPTRFANMGMAASVWRDVARLEEACRLAGFGAEAYAKTVGIVAPRVEVGLNADVGLWADVGAEAWRRIAESQAINPTPVSRLQSVLPESTGRWSGIDTAAGFGRGSEQWKPVLMRFSRPYAGVLDIAPPGIQNALYHVVRPSLFSVAEQVLRAQGLAAGGALVSWSAAPSVSDIGIEVEDDVEEPFAAEPSLATTSNGPALQDLFGFDTRAPRHKMPLVVREIVVWVAGHPWIVRIAGGAACGGGGGVVGFEIGGPVGAAIGGVMGGIGSVVTEYIVVSTQRRKP